MDTSAKEFQDMHKTVRHNFVSELLHHLGGLLEPLAGQSPPREVACLCLDFGDCRVALPHLNLLRLFPWRGIMFLKFTHVASVSAVCSFLWPNSIPLWDRILVIYADVRLCIISTLQEQSCRDHFCNKSFYGPITGAVSRSMCDFSANFSTVFQSGSTSLDFETSNTKRFLPLLVFFDTWYCQFFLFYFSHSYQRVGVSYCDSKNIFNGKVSVGKTMTI